MIAILKMCRFVVHVCKPTQFCPIFVTEYQYSNKNNDDNNNNNYNYI